MHTPAVIKCFLLIAITISLVLHNGLYAAEDDKFKTQQQFRQDLDKWMMQAYEGDKDAQFKVGVLFTNDQFRKPDYQQAVYWYKQAARQGHVLAQYNLGHQYLTGVGVQKNEKQAMQWWLKAAEQGHALSQFNIGRAYYLGIGLDKNIEKSKHWFRQAANNNEPKSIDILNKLGWNQETQQTAKATKPNKPAKQDKPAKSQAQVTENKKSTDKVEPKVSQETPKSIASKEHHEVINQPLALYTNPAVRSVLITIQDSNHKMEVINRGKKWSAVRITDGFPVWVHSDFIKENNDYATITGDAVNARAVPIITQGTIVGKLNKGEKLLIVDSQRDWYRVISPVRFKAWIKTQNLEKLPQSIVGQSSQNNKAKEKQAKNKLNSKVKNNNQWLFAQPKENFTIQLGSFDTQEKVTAFLAQAKSLDQSKFKSFTAAGKEAAWTYFLYGSYSSKNEAEAAQKNIKQKKSWVRSFSKLTQNRCIAWKKQIPSPKELNQYCKD